MNLRATARRHPVRARATERRPAPRWPRRTVRLPSETTEPSEAVYTSACADLPRAPTSDARKSPNFSEQAHTYGVPRRWRDVPGERTEDYAESFRGGKMPGVRRTLRQGEVQTSPGVGPGRHEPEGSEISSDFRGRLAAQPDLNCFKTIL